MVRGDKDEVISTLVDYIRDGNFQTFSVRKDGQDANNFIFQQREDEDREMAINRLEKTLSKQEGRFVLEGRTPEKANQTKGGHKIDFILPPHDAKVSGVSQQQPTVGMVTMDELERRLNEAHEAWVREQEVKDLRAKTEEQEKEIAELKKPINEVIRKLSPLLEPAVGLLARKMMPTAPATASIGRLETQEAEQVPVEPYETMPAPEPEMTSEDEDELLAVYAKFKEIDPDCLTLLKAVAKIGISQQPIMGLPYENVKQMIINQANTIE